MALSFLFGGNTGETPQSIRQKRDLARAILGASNSPKNVGEGLNALGDGLVAGVLNRRADKAEAEGTKTADALFNSIIGGGNGSTSTPASSVPMTGAASEIQAGSPQSYRDAIASIESAGSGNYSAVGPTSPSMGRALGRYQVMEANIPQWSREALGREVSADEFLANPQLQDAIFDKKFGGYVSQYGPQGAAQAWFAGPAGVGKLDRKDSLGTTVSAYTNKFSRALGQPTQVASLDPSAGMPQPAAAHEMQSSSPTPGNIPIPTARPPAPAAAPAPAPTQIAQAQPAQAPQAAPQRAQINPLYLQALNNPWLSEGQRASVKMLIEQDLQAQQQAQEESTWRAREDYKLAQQKADPGYQLEQDYKQAQLDALKAKTGSRANVTNLGDGWLWDNDEKKAFRPQDEAGKPSGGFRFGGNSVEAQALNGLIESGQLTVDQAQQLAAGKTITDPSTGAMAFLTPQGIFRQPGAATPQPQQQQQSVDLFGDSAPQQQPQSVDLFGTSDLTAGPVTVGGVGSPAAQSAPATPNAPSPSVPAPASAAPAPAAAPSNAGIIPLTAGKPSNQLTESERKNRSLFSVIQPELKTVEDNFAALSDLGNQAGSQLPLSDYVTTPAYQKAANSLQTIVSSYLYSVSGATATPEEVRKQTDILTPRPGESKESIDAKRRRVRTMVNAVATAGSLPPLEEPAAAASPQAENPLPPTPQPQGPRPRAVNPQTGQTIEFDGTQWVPVL